MSDVKYVLYNGKVEQYYDEDGGYVWLVDSGYAAKKSECEPVVEHNGNFYREVKREANVGELVKIVETGSHEFKMGEITEITEYDQQSNSQKVRGDLDIGWLFNDQYVVLEPIGQTQPERTSAHERIEILFDKLTDIERKFATHYAVNKVEEGVNNLAERIQANVTEITRGIASLSTEVVRLKSSQSPTDLQPLTHEILAADLPAIDRLELALKHERHTADLRAIFDGAGDVDGEIKAGMRVRSKETGKTYEVVSRLVPDEHKLSLSYVSHFSDNFEIVRGADE